MNPEPALGRLLVASPTLLDPNFQRTVVLLLAHGDEGTLGVVLNRPAEVPLADVLPTWAALATAPTSIFVGGPVAPGSALCLASLRPGADRDGWTAVRGPAGILDLDLGPESVADRITRLRVFSGYAGWGPAQLAGEISSGAWFVVEGEPGDPFAPEPGRLWGAVLRRQRFDLAILATCPLDPSLN
ncbi:MAG: YqgE/AlgH family protein [Candidatus Dormibacteraeota bacterium]|nr:YqgE/AlgH family protein [Candidatus Dormibacteraeota bacterium]